MEFSHWEDVFGYDTGGQLSKRFGERHIALRLEIQSRMSMLAMIVACNDAMVRCEERIRNRGVAHHALRPSEKLRSVLQKAGHFKWRFHQDLHGECAGSEACAATEP